MSCNIFQNHRFFMQFEDNNESVYVYESNRSVSPDAVPRSVDEQSYKMNIYVYQPRVNIRHIKLNPNNSISVLNQMYKPDSTYIYNGQILDIQKSFHYYRISSESKIVLIPSFMSKRDPNFVERWLQITSDKDNFEKKIETNINIKNKREIARIKDIRYIKNELRRKHLGSYLSECASRRLNSNLESNDDNIVLSTDYKTPDVPSCEPLPLIW